MAIGVAFVEAFQHNREWLLVMPVVLAIMYQAYLYRSRSTDERRIWRDFAEIAQSLNQLDERGVVIAAVTGVQRLFVAAAVEVWVDRLASAPGGYRGTQLPNGDVETIELAGRPVDHPVPPSAVQALSINGTDVGELRIWMPAGSRMELRELMALSVVSEAIAAALLDASAHRALRVLAARSVHDAHHDVLTGLLNRASLVRTGDEVIAAVASAGAHRAVPVRHQPVQGRQRHARPSRGRRPAPPDIRAARRVRRADRSGRPPHR